MELTAETQSRYGNFHEPRGRRRRKTQTRFQPERPMSSSSSEPTTERGGDKIKRLDEDKVKFDVGDCEPLSKASMKCLEDLGYDRALARTECKPQHDAYRACRQQELDARKAANAEWAKRVGLRW